MKKSALLNILVAIDDIYGGRLFRPSSFTDREETRDDIIVRMTNNWYMILGEAEEDAVKGKLRSYVAAGNKFPPSAGELIPNPEETNYERYGDRVPNAEETLQRLRAEDERVRSWQSIDPDGELNKRSRDLSRSYLLAESDEQRIKIREEMEALKVAREKRKQNCLASGTAVGN